MWDIQGRKRTGPEAFLAGGLDIRDSLGDTQMAVCRAIRTAACGLLQESSGGGGGVAAVAAVEASGEGGGADHGEEEDARVSNM